MPFNLARKKAKHPIQRLRAIEGLEDIRPSDIETNDEAEIQRMVGMLGRQVVAVHGRGDNWIEVGRGGSPHTSPLVNAVPQFGGQWRNMPGGGDMHINDDSDKAKNTKGQATDDDFDPSGKRQRINDALKFPNQSFIVRLYLGPNASKGMAKRLFGDEGLVDGNSVYVVVDDYAQARRLQRKAPGAIIETGG